jgi:hypothetical protein
MDGTPEVVSPQKSICILVTIESLRSRRYKLDHRQKRHHAKESSVKAMRCLFIALLLCTTATLTRCRSSKSSTVQSREIVEMCLLPKCLQLTQQQNTRRKYLLPFNVRCSKEPSRHAEIYNLSNVTYKSTLEFGLLCVLSRDAY